MWAWLYFTMFCMQLEVMTDNPISIVLRSLYILRRLNITLNKLFINFPQLIYLLSINHSLTFLLKYFSFTFLLKYFSFTFLLKYFSFTFLLKYFSFTFLLKYFSFTFLLKYFSFTFLLKYFSFTFNCLFNYLIFITYSIIKYIHFITLYVFHDYIKYLYIADII